MQQLLHFKIANLLGQTGKGWVEEMQQRENKMQAQYPQVEISNETGETAAVQYSTEEHVIYVDPAKKDTDTFKMHEIQEELHHNLLNPAFVSP